MTADLERELIERWLDGGLDQDELQRLQARLVADPVFAQAAAVAAGDRWNLRESLRALEESPAAPSARQRIASPGRLPARRRQRTRHSRRRRVAVFALPLLLGLVAILAGVMAQGPAQLPIGERLLVVGGPVERIGEILEPTAALQAEAALVLSTPGQACTLELTAGSTLRYAGGYPEPLLLVLDQGELRAEVAPRPPGSPLRIATPDAELEVVGTAFTIAYRERTRVEVHEGLVRMLDRASGRISRIGAGQAWTANDQPPVEVRPQPAVDLQVDAGGGVDLRGPLLGDLTVAALPAEGLRLGATHTSSGSGEALLTVLRAASGLSLVVDAVVEQAAGSEVFAAELVLPRLQAGERTWDLVQLRVPLAAVPDRARVQLAAIWNGERLEILRDGQRLRSSTPRFVAADWMVPVQLKLAPSLGSEQSGRIRIHRVQIFDRALDPAQLASLAKED